MFPRLHRKSRQNLLQVGQEQSDERIIKPAFDRTEQTNPSLVVNQFGVVVTANEVQNKAQSAKSNIKSQFPSLEATSDVVAPQVNLTVTVSFI